MVQINAFTVLSDRHDRNCPTRRLVDQAARVIQGPDGTPYIELWERQYEVARRRKGSAKRVAVFGHYATLLRAADARVGRVSHDSQWQEVPPSENNWNLPPV